MRQVRASSVLRMGIACAIALAVGLGFSLALDAWAMLEQHWLRERHFAAASELDQRAIVGSLLVEETAKPPLCSPTGRCPEEPIYFDQLSATLRFSDVRGPSFKYDVVTVRSGGALMDRADTSVPIPLQDLLDNLSRVPTRNADPMMSRVTYVRDSEGFTLDAGPGGCSDVRQPRLIRVGRAAVQEPEGLALALVITTYCDQSFGVRVAKLRRDGAAWHVLASDQARRR
jgi:hypothetical protein